MGRCKIVYCWMLKNTALFAGKINWRITKWESWGMNTRVQILIITFTELNIIQANVECSGKWIAYLPIHPKRPFWILEAEKMTNDKQLGWMASLLELLRRWQSEERKRMEEVNHFSQRATWVYGTRMLRLPLYPSRKPSYWPKQQISTSFASDEEYRDPWTSFKEVKRKSKHSGHDVHCFPLSMDQWRKLSETFCHHFLRVLGNEML